MRDGHFHGHWHGRHRGPGHGPGRRGGRGGRFFEHGDLKLVILALLAEQPRHGYEIIKEIEERLGGTYAPSAGAIYPSLTLLEELGYARVESADGPKKLYAVTPEGEAYLAQNRASVDALFARMNEAAGGRSAMPRIMRAMHNLKFALRLRVSRGALSEDDAAKIAGILDSAALDIERI